MKRRAGVEFHPSAWTEERTDVFLGPRRWWRFKLFAVCLCQDRYCWACRPRTRYGFFGVHIPSLSPELPVPAATRAYPDPVCCLSPIPQNLTKSPTTFSAEKAVAAVSRQNWTPIEIGPMGRQYWTAGVHFRWTVVNCTVKVLLHEPPGRK